MPRGGFAMATKVVDNVRVNADGSELPDYVKSLNIPPAWKGVV